MKKEEKKDLQKEFDIDENNYDMYYELYCFKKGNIVDKDNYTKILPLLCGGTVAIVTFGSVAISSFVATSLSASDVATGIVSTVSGFSSLLISFPLLFKLYKKLDEIHLRRKFPDVNMDVDADALEKALERYKDLSIVPKDIDLLLHDSLEKYSDEIKKMSTGEKIVYFKRQKFLWEMEAIREKYRLVDDNETIIVKSKSNDRMMNNVNE